MSCSFCRQCPACNGAVLKVTAILRENDVDSIRLFFFFLTSYCAADPLETNYKWSISDWKFQPPHQTHIRLLAEPLFYSFHSRLPLVVKPLIKRNHRLCRHKPSWEALLNACPSRAAPWRSDWLPGLTGFGTVPKVLGNVSICKQKRWKTSP